MPVIVRRPLTAPAPTTAPTPPTPTKARIRRRRLNGAATDLAPIIAEIKQEGHHSNAEIAKRLNELKLKAPSGGPFTLETTRRLQLRIKALGLGGGPRSVSDALKERHRMRREKENVELERILKEVNELKAQQRRENPDWQTTRPWLR